MTTVLSSKPTLETFTSANPVPPSLPQLLPKYEEVGGVIDGSGSDPLRTVPELIKAVINIPDQLPAGSKLGLNVSWEEVLKEYRGINGG